MLKIVFLDRETLGPSVQMSKPATKHQWMEYNATSSAQVVERLRGAQVAITNKVGIRRAHLLDLPALKLIVVAATGYNCVDLDACRELGITVCNVRDYAKNTVPEHVLALTFALRRGIVGYRQDVIDGQWERSGQFCFHTHPIKDLAGQTFGVVGKGALGESVGQLAAALGMKVQYAARKGDRSPASGYVEFEEFLATSDVITLHCPLTPETTGLIGDAEFALMSRHPLLINTGRGGLVDEAAAVRAVEAGQVAGLGFDVVTQEPMPSGHIFEVIMQRPNVIITPHVAWASEEAMQALWDQVVSHIDNFAAGRPSNVLN